MTTTLPSTDLRADILALKEQRNAVILAHNYQNAEIQEIADYVGDSLGLSFRAQETDADVIAFCGVHFMAETAKIINPEKTVVLPDADAGCSLEESCPADELGAFLRENAEKNYYVVTYINSSAAVKALSDVICTSGNAVRIVVFAVIDGAVDWYEFGPRKKAFQAEHDQPVASVHVLDEFSPLAAFAFLGFGCAGTGAVVIIGT